MSDTLSYVKEMGIDSTDTTPETEVEVNDTENFVQDSTTEESESVANVDTVPDVSMELQKQIEGLEKRIADKDDYINLLREQGNHTEADAVEAESDTSTDFWDDPEKIVQDMRANQETQQRRIDEMLYARSVDDYWDTVTEEAFTQAMAADKAFVDEINSSSNVYDTAYKYFTKKKSTEEASVSTLREEIKAELLKEMGMDKPKKEGLPNIGKMGGSNPKHGESNANDDGFASVFGQR